MEQVIRPAQRLSGELRVPGDRSITVRAVLLGAIAEGESVVHGYLESDDTTACINAMRALGVRIDRLPAPRLPPSAAGGQRPATSDQPPVPALRIRGAGLRGLRPAASALYCDASGTTLRLLAGLMSGQSFDSVLDGSPQLRQRPMRRITEPLRAMGAGIEDAAGCAPLRVRGRSAPLRGIDYAMPVASAQVKSALLLAGLYADGPTLVREPAPTRDHTERMLAAAGTAMSFGDGLTRLEPPRGLAPFESLSVPADFSSAAFFLAAGAIHPRAALELRDVGLNPTRTGLLDALRQMGARIAVRHPRDEGGEPVGDLLPAPGRLQAIEVGGELVARMIDEFPAFAVAATQARGTTVVRDAGELRVKESDRIDGLVQELRKMGARIEATPDGFVIDGPTRLRGAVVDGRGDHRMAMALAVAALAAEGETTITGAECVSKTYPRFFEDLSRVGIGD
jgi:3-phosphoshikimate 1-carboxyvinyltransferase